MRAVHIIQSLDPLKGGTTECLRLLTAASEDARIQSHVITLDDPKSSWLTAWKTTVVSLGPSITHYSWIKGLRHKIGDQLQPGDVVIIHGLWQHHCPETRIACMQAGIPYVVYPHGMLDPWALRHNPWKRVAKSIASLLFMRRVFEDASLLCFTCEEEREAALPALSGTGTRQFVSPLGIEAPSEDLAKLREEFHSTHPELLGKRIILQLGRLHPKKGCDLAIEGFARWKHSSGSRDAHLRMVGPPSSEDYLKSLLQLSDAFGLEVGTDISFPGMISGRGKWSELAACESLILPSHQENFGLVVGEALACKKPVLLSDRVNTWSWVTEAEAGFAAPPTTVGVEELLSNWSSLSEKGRTLMGERAHQLFTTRFSIGASVKSFRRMLDSAQDSPMPAPR